MTRLTLPYPPSANRYWATRVVGKGRAARAVTYVTTEAKAYREDVAWRARLARITPIAGRVALTVRLFPHRPKDWERRRRKDPEGWADTVQCIDLGNCEKVLSDALNGIAWEDDAMHRRILLERCDPDELGARVEIEIEQIQPERAQLELVS